MPYDTALRGYTAKRIEEIDSADILIGIPCYNNEKTIAHVIQMVTHGLAEHYNGRRCVILVADGGSTDDTREAARDFEIKPWQEKIVSIYRGPAGKGTALRSVFEAAEVLRVRACAVVDADLRSITSDWVPNLLSPVLDKGFHFVAPVYLRHKYDATITNNIVYNLTRALYGKRIRQPIGGDFAFSREVARFYAQQDVWETDVARYGVDIWMTTTAITQGFQVCQSNLGIKVHDAKDPAVQLGPMFRQVLFVLFSLMERLEDAWKPVKGSVPVETFGPSNHQEPEPVAVDLEALVDRFKTGFQQFSPLWKEIFCPTCFEAIRSTAALSTRDFSLSTSTWIQILYELAATFHSWTRNRFKIIELVTPLYYARVASFVRETLEMSSEEAENLVEEQALEFEKQKDYLIRVWDEKKAAASAPA
ncbi:MAG: glycosyltransferase family 2 protein [Candidatus Aminicenantes bacterium]|nr:glycosyltransferase family 2 protein [Candidatus Aminicenantes bacterium]